jgi:hypothetical protein
MIISHTNKYIFIKSTKTAGTSIEAALSNHCRGDDIVTPLGDYAFNRDESGAWVHQSMNEGRYRQHDDARTIRDSLPAEVALMPEKRLVHRLGVPVDELAPARQAFTRFLKEEEWDTNDRFYIIDGQLCIDRVIRYEQLADDLKQVCSHVGLPELTLPHLKSGMRQKQHHYSAYYQEQTRDLVAERHRNDIDLFGYRFEQA